MKNFRELLKKPGRDSQPWALWHWNLVLSHSELLQQFEWFVKNGFGGIVIRPSRDMVPAYLSDEFFAFFDDILRRAQKQGIAVRIGDDFSLPWGGCFNDAMARSEQMRAQQLRLIENRALAAGERVDVAAGDRRDSIVLAVGLKEGVINPSHVHELQCDSSSSSGGWQTPAEGEWQLMVFCKEAVRDPLEGLIPNVFNQKAAAIYIQDVLENFKARFFKLIPAQFEGFMCELPSCRPGENSIPWDNDMVVKFRSKSKKNIIKLLPALFCENYPVAQKVRQQVYSFMYELMFERFVAPLEAWARKNRLSQWVLVSERSTPYGAAPSQAEGYVPSGVDLNSVGFQNIGGVAESHALLRVVSDSNGNEFRRETVTVIGRNPNGVGSTLLSLKSDFDAVLLSGSSKIMIDGFFCNLDQRSYVKTPYGPGWYSPGNEQMIELCRYIARCQEMVRGIHWNRQVAVLVPTASIMAETLPGDGSAAVVGMQRLENTVCALEKCGIGFDMITETQLAACTVRTNGEFGTADRIRKGNYQALIVPYAPHISRNVLLFIEKLVQKEGRVFFVEEAPHGTIEDGASATMSSRIEKIIGGRHKGTGVISADSFDDMCKFVVPHLRIGTGNKDDLRLYHAFGSAEGYELYLFHNISDIKDQIVRIELGANKHFTMIDCETGELCELDTEAGENGGNTVQLSAYPKTTVMIVGSSTASGHGSHTVNPYSCNPFMMSERSYRIVLKDQWEFSTSSLNALPLTSWNVRIGLSRESGGFSHFYETHFQARSVPDICTLVFASPCIKKALAVPIEITINGVRVEPGGEGVVQPQPQGQSETDEENPVVPKVLQEYDTSVVSHYIRGAVAFPIGDLLVRGFNRISIRTTGQVLDPCTIHYPPMLFGDFVLGKGQNGWAIDRTEEADGDNSWNTHGYPYLCGKAFYNQSFEIPNEYKRLIMRFSEVSGPINVTLNDKNLGIYNWQPVEIDITSVCEAKRNELVIGVVNSIDTVLRLNGRPSGLIGDVFLDVY